MEKCSSVADRFRITICPFGLWDENGIRKLWEKDDPKGDSFGEQLNSTANLHHSWTILVPVVSISQFIHDQTESDDLVTIKIDAEGSEYPILSSILQAPLDVFERITQIFTEWHHCPINNGYPSRDETQKMFHDRLLSLEQWMF